MKLLQAARLKSNIPSIQAGSEILPQLRTIVTPGEKTLWCGPKPIGCTLLSPNKMSAIERGYDQRIAAAFSQRRRAGKATNTAANVYCVMQIPHISELPRPKDGASFSAA